MSGYLLVKPDRRQDQDHDDQDRLEETPVDVESCSWPSFPCHQENQQQHYSNDQDDCQDIHVDHCTRRPRPPTLFPHLVQDSPQEKPVQCGDPQVLIHKETPWEPKSTKLHEAHSHGVSTGDRNRTCLHPIPVGGGSSCRGFTRSRVSIYFPHGASLPEITSRSCWSY